MSYVEGFDLTNKMLQSELQEWPTMLQQIFEIYSGNQENGFWLFIGQLSFYMPTPALQVTLIGLEKQRQQGWYYQVAGRNCERHKLLEETISKCAKNMNKHVAELKTNM